MTWFVVGLIVDGMIDLFGVVVFVLLFSLFVVVITLDLFGLV